MNPYPQRHRLRQRETFLLQSFNLFDRANNPGWSGSIPSRAFFSIASACRGYPGATTHPVPEKGHRCWFPSDFEDGNGQFFSQRRAIQEHSASAQDCITCFAYSLPALASLLRHRSYRTSAVCEKVLWRDRCQFGIIQRVDQRMNVVTPCMVPSSSMAFSGVSRGDLARL